MNARVVSLKQLSLTGLTIAVTGSRRASELAALITNLGGIPFVAPTVGIQSVERLDAETEDLMNQIISGNVDFAIFMTGPGTYAFFDWADKQGCKRQLVDALNNIRVVARSPKPVRALNQHQVHVDLVPDDNTTEGIATAMKQSDLQGKTAAVLWHGASKPILKQELEACGAKLLEAMVYNYSLELGTGGEKILTTMGFKPIPPDEEKVVGMINEIHNGSIQAITFTSPPSARNLFQIAATHNLATQLIEDLNKKVIVVAVGPPTKEAVESNRVKVDVMPRDYKLGPMIKALEDHVGLRHQKQKLEKS